METSHEDVIAKVIKDFLISNNYTIDSDLSYLCASPAIFAIDITPGKRLSTTKYLFIEFNTHGEVCVGNSIIPYEHILLADPDSLSKLLEIIKIKSAIPIIQ